MRIKIIILGCCISIFVIYLASKSNKTQLKTMPEQSINAMGSSPALQKNIQSKNIKVTSNRSKKKLTPKTTQFQAIYQELENQKYSDDPLLEFTSIKIEFSLCKRMRNRDTRINTHNYSQTSDKLQKLIEEHSESCDELTSQYPTIASINNNSKHEMLLLYLAASSKYLGLIQDGLVIKYKDKRQQNDFLVEVIKAVINSENAPLISLLPELLNNQKIDASLFSPIANILGTINLEYILSISKQAIALKSCQYNQGITCTAASSYMLFECNFNENACGKDVLTWFSETLTDAQNRDVYLVLDYLNSY